MIRSANARFSRRISLVAMVVVVVVIGAACGSSESSKSSDRPRPAESWQLSLTTAAGKPLTLLQANGAPKQPHLLVGGTYVVSATVPSALRATLAGKTVELQHRSGTDGDWKTVKQVRVAADGRIDEKFTAGKDLINRHDYRLAVVETGTSPTTTGSAAGGEDVRLMSAIRPAQVASGLVSETTSAVGDVQFAVEITNGTIDDLKIFFPGALSSTGTYQEGEVDVAKGSTVTVLYTNPPAGAGIHLRVNKKSCLGSCTNYITNWDWQPHDYLGINKKGFAPCSASMPQFLPGQTYQVLLAQGDKYAPLSDGYGFAAGQISGPINGADAAGASCTFDLESSFRNWLDNHPVDGFLLAAAAVAIIAVAIALTVETGGADLELAPVVIEAIDEGAVTTVTAGAETAAPDLSYAAGAQNFTGGFVDTSVKPWTSLQGFFRV